MATITWASRASSACLCSGIAAVHRGDADLPGLARPARSPRSPAPRARASGRARARRPAVEDGSSRSTIGIAKASVLPEPVGLLASTSPPRIASGITTVWIGNGASMPVLAEHIAHGIRDAERAEKLSHWVCLLLVGRDPVTRRRKRDLTGEPTVTLHADHGSSWPGGHRRRRRASVAVAAGHAVEPRLEQPQPVLELRDAELELVPVVARDEAELAEEVAQPLRACPRRRAARRRASARSPRRAASAPRRAAGRSSASRRSIGVAVAVDVATVGSSMRPRLAALPAPFALRVLGVAVVAVADRASDSPSSTASTSVDRLDRVLDRRPSASRAPGRRPRPPRRAQERRVRRSRSSTTSLRRAYSGSRSIRLVSSGVAMKIVRDGTDRDPDHDREREVLQRRAAEDEQRDDREQRDHRRDDRPAQHLPHRDVRDRARCSRAASAACSRARGRRR